VVHEEPTCVWRLLSTGGPTQGITSVRCGRRWGVGIGSGGLPRLTDRSHRPHHHPGQLVSEVGARVCELRRTHPRWLPWRLVHELRRLGVDPVASRSTVYRVLVRHSLRSVDQRGRVGVISLRVVTIASATVSVRPLVQRGWECRHGRSGRTSTRGRGADCSRDEQVLDRMRVRSQGGELGSARQATR
jgi:Homeodomain-like domain